MHRDIKPSSILLQAGHAVVAHFGIARLTSEPPGGSAHGHRLFDRNRGVPGRPGGSDDTGGDVRPP